jgi:hypothetical protein
LQQLEQILKIEGEKGVQLYRKSLTDNNRVVTGQTAQSIKYTVKNGDTLIFTGDDHILSLEDGRKPSESTGGRGFFEQIEQWVLDRGIPIEAAYPIYRKINKEGYEGTEGLLSIPSDEIIKDTKEAIGESILNNIRTSFKTFKDNK